MNRKVSTDDFKDFIKEHYKSKADFRKKLEISQSHLYSLLNGEVMMGIVTLRKLEKECLKFGVDVESLFRPVPVKVNGDMVEQINITKNGEAIASITSRNIIIKDGYSVDFVPY